MHSEFRLRPAVRSDAAGIRRLVRDTRINPSGIDWRRFLVAVDAMGSVIGCGQVKPHTDGSRELASIAVAHGWRRRGVAGALIVQLLESADPPLWLTCRSELVGLYQRFGFREVRPDEPQPRACRRARRLLRGLRALTGIHFAIMAWDAETRGR